jgi:transposase
MIGRPLKVSDEYLPIARELVEAHPTEAVVDLARRFSERTGISVNRQLMAKVLKRAGVVRTAAVDRSHRAPTPLKSPHRFNDRHRRRGPEGGYPSSLTDYEWSVVADIFERPGPGRPPKYPRRLLLDGILYVLRTGCSWRMLPKDFPHWTVVYRAFRDWTEKGLIIEMHGRLAEMWRLRLDKNAQPTAAVIDSQSVATSPQGGPLGFDAGKKVKGRKRHIATDTVGLLLAALVTSASVQDRDGAMPVLERARARHPHIERVFVDGGYAGRAADAMRATGVDVEVVRRTDRHRWTLKNARAQLELYPSPSRGFHVLPKRWVVERSHAWHQSARRCLREHDRLPEVSASWLWLAQARLLLSRLDAASLSEAA